MKDWVAAASIYNIYLNRAVTFPLYTTFESMDMARGGDSKVMVPNNALFYTQH